IKASILWAEALYGIQIHWRNGRRHTRKVKFYLHLSMNILYNNLNLNLRHLHI
ncbi:uncharacterized protein METZ01_LOCUS393640, partial [marine metagenome]